MDCVVLNGLGKSSEKRVMPHMFRLQVPYFVKPPPPTL